MVSLCIYGKTKKGTMAEVFVCDFENETIAYNFVYKHKIKGALLYKDGHFLIRESAKFRQLEKYF